MTPETPQFKAHCEQIIGRLPELSQTVVRKTLDVLKAPPNELTNTYGRNGLLALGLKLHPQQARCQESLLHRLQAEISQARLKHTPSTERKTQITRLDELSLVDDSAADSHIELARTVQEIELVTEWSLRELQAYTAALRAESSIRPDDNPFKPATFARALSDAIGALDISGNERNMLLRAASKVMADALNKLYLDANARLEANGITPVEYNTVVNLHAPVAPLVDMTRPGALDKLLNQLPGGAGLSHAEVTAALDQALNPAFAKTTGADHNQAPQRIRGLNQLWERMVRESGSVPFVQPLVRSLQTSILRLAVREPDMVDDLQHPSWQFIHHLVESVSGFRPEEHSEQRSFVEQITPVVHHLASQEAPTAQHYEQASAHIHKIFAEQTEALLASRAATLKALEEADHLETLKGLLQHQVDQHLEGRTVPMVASDFLRGPWVDVMVQVITNEPSGDDDAMSLLNVVEDLVVSLQRPTSLAERDQLRDMLPSLTQRLRQGMAMINWPPKQRGDLMEQLMVVHARYLRSNPLAHAGNTTPGELTPQEIVSRMRAEHLDSVWAQHDPSPEPQVQVGALPTVPMGLTTAGSAAQTAAKMAAAWSADIKPGTWFKVSIQGEWVNARLMWVSANQRFFIFTGKHADEIHTLPVSVLIKLRQEGFITQLPQQSLVQRAADSLFSDLDD